MLLCGFTGFVLGYLVGLGIINDNFTRWETIILPETMHPISFVISEGPVAYIQTQEEEILMNNCAEWYSNEVMVWRPVTDAITPTTDLKHYDQCHPEQPYENWPTIFRPTSKVQEQIDCIHILNVENYIHCRYVILENNTTRLWRSSSCGLGGLFIVFGSAILFALVSAPVGGLIYAIRTKQI